MHSFFAGHPLRDRRSVEELELIMQRNAKKAVERQWDYWSPIVTGAVAISRSEYDAMSPDEHRRFVIALSIQRFHEQKSMEDAKKR